MSRKIRAILALVCALLLVTTTAYATPVEFSNGSPSISATYAGNGGAYTLTTDRLQLLGVNENGSILVFAAGQYLDVTLESLRDVAPELPEALLNNLPETGELATLDETSRGEPVINLQNALKELGYLTGSADGVFGGKTTQAISDFQAAMGLAETGRADEMLQLLMFSELEAPQTVAAVIDPVKQYAVLADKTDIDLNVLAESGMNFSYDDIAGVGEISDGTEIHANVSGSADIDKYEFTIEFAILTQDNEDGSIALEPAVKASCLCLRRPMMQELILKSGDKRCQLAFDAVKSELSGASSLESGVAYLDDEAVELLAGAIDAGELKLRIVGKYKSFDLSLSGAQLESAVKVGSTAQTLQ